MDDTTIATTTGSVDALGRDEGVSDDRRFHLVDIATEVEQIALGAIRPSPYNKRRTYAQAALDELASSIRVHGVLQPIVVRPAIGDANNPLAEFEIIAGERRFRAAQIAELTHIPAIVRDVTDVRQLLEMQTVENLQREDLHPLEEAEQLEQLMTDASAPVTVDQVAERVGKSRSYVYGRLKLLDLLPKARQAFIDGKLTPRTALFVARVPKDRQIDALGRLTTYYGAADGPISVRSASDILQREFMLVLREAPFPIRDAKLLVGKPACNECPKRTGAEPDLFEDVKGKDVCTDPTCYHEKVRAHAAREVSKAKDAGIPVIEGAEAKKLWKQHAMRPDGYVDPDARNYEVDNGAKTNRELAGDAQPVLVVNPHTGVAERFLAAKDVKQAVKAKAGDTPQAKAEKKRQLEMAVRRDVLAACLAKENFHAEDDRAITQAMWDRLSGDAERELRKVLPDLPARDKMAEHINGSQDSYLWMLQIAMAHAPSLNIWAHQTDMKAEAIEALASRRNVDVAAIRAKHVAAAKAKAKPAKKKPEPTISPKPDAKAKLAKSLTRTKVTARKAKYRDQFGNTWSGRGQRPRWLVEQLNKGRKLEEFDVERAEKPEDPAAAKGPPPTGASAPSDPKPDAQSAEPTGVVGWPFSGG
jgi:ParB/RepB/Spo0J family partition protein